MENHSCTAKLAKKIPRRITRSLSRLDGLLLLLETTAGRGHNYSTPGCPTHSPSEAHNPFNLRLNWLPHASKAYCQA